MLLHRNCKNVRSWILIIVALVAWAFVLVFKQAVLFAPNESDDDSTITTLQLNAKKEQLYLENDNEDYASAATTTTEVKWIRDVAWFQNEVKKGCCPYAKQIYNKRYANIEFRCCTSKISRGDIDPLRATGGVDYSQIFHRGTKHNVQENNLSMFIQGDSLAEQHFVGMVCYAWSTDLKVDLKRLSSQRDQNDGTIWQANISEHYSNNQFTIHYLRWDRPTVPSKTIIDYNLLGRPNFIFLSGWHHGLSDNHSITKFLQKMSTNGISGYGNENVYVVDALPSHFPGGEYEPDESLYSSISNRNSGGSSLCEQYNAKGNPDINHNLVEIIEKVRNENETNSNVTLLHVSQLYHHRGNAHVERQNDKRDCLHWCIAPGVMDALTRMTLAAIYERVSSFDEHEDS
jgi:hypothetical protein